MNSNYNPDLPKDNISGDLPPVVRLSQFRNNIPEPPPELIEGVLRRGHKMILASASKAGKTYLLMELAISFAEGVPWLGRRCKQGKVLYINLEVDPRSCIRRFYEIYESLGIPADHTDNIDIWNLRGHSLPLDQLVPKIIASVQKNTYDVLILDPIYKVLTGDENSASDMSYFTNQLDMICAELGCAVIYCHHHSKGFQGAKRSIDRASGSGVFSRDADAQLDMIELDTSKINSSFLEAKAFRISFTLREFADGKPINCWFNHPVHCLDTDGVLEDAPESGSSKSNLSRSGKRTSEEDRHKALDDAFNACSNQSFVRVSDLENASGLSGRTIRTYIKEFPDDYLCDRGIVSRIRNPSLARK